MIEVKVTMVPQGHTNESFEIFDIKVINDATHPLRPQYGNYLAIVKTNKGEKRFRIENHLRSEGLWPVLEQITRTMQGKPCLKIRKKSSSSSSLLPES